MLFVEIYAKKRQISVSEPHFGEDDTRPWLMLESLWLTFYLL